MSLPLPRSVAHATKTWCQRFIDSSRAYVADAVPIEILVRCGRVDVAIEMARIPRPSERVVANLVSVASAMTRERVSAERIDDVWLEAIANVSRTGRVGDGRIMVGNLEQAIRIRTGETGTAAT